MLRKGFYILAICGAAGFSGVMLSIGVILGRFWQSLEPSAFLQWFSEYSHFVSSAIPLVVLPTMIGLLGSVAVSWRIRGARNLWLAATLCVAAVLVITFVYFVPSNTAFVNADIAVADVAKKLSQWLSIHSVRIGLAMLAAVLGVLATIVESTAEKS